MSQSATFIPQMGELFFFNKKVREALKKGLFNDIDPISFNTHPPPPKDDIWKND